VLPNHGSKGSDFQVRVTSASRLRRQNIPAFLVTTTSTPRYRSARCGRAAAGPGVSRSR
jgi:hypothetical protein